jgi:glycine/D-amino acid oxidase-like deaminating enzyme
MMGITQGPATGKLVAELLTDSKTTLDIDLLAPGRF